MMKNRRIIYEGVQYRSPSTMISENQVGEILSRRQRNESISQIARTLNLSRATVRRCGSVKLAIMPSKSGNDALGVAAQNFGMLARKSKKQVAPQQKCFCVAQSDVRDVDVLPGDAVDFAHQAPGQQNRKDVVLAHDSPDKFPTRRSGLNCGRCRRQLPKTRRPRP